MKNLFEEIISEAKNNLQKHKNLVSLLHQTEVQSMDQTTKIIE